MSLHHHKVEAPRKRSYSFRKSYILFVGSEVVAVEMLKFECILLVTDYLYQNRRNEAQISTGPIFFYP